MLTHRARRVLALATATTALPLAMMMGAQGASADTGSKIASIASANLGEGYCSTNSAGGSGFYTSCGGENWCADFAKWVWSQDGVDVSGLTPAAGSFGQYNGGLHSTPHVGDAVVFGYDGSSFARHVAIVTAVNSDGTITSIGGNEGNNNQTLSTVRSDGPYSAALGYSSYWGMNISGYASPIGGLGTEKPSSIGAYDPSTGKFYEGNLQGAVLGSNTFGNPNWTPLTGDWKGTGTSTFGAYDPTTGKFYLSLDNSTAYTSFTFGNPNWVPLVGDWTGSGTDHIGAYDPTTGTFYLTSDNSTVIDKVTFGNPNWIPVTGDWTGSGKDGIGAYDPTTGTFYLALQDGTLVDQTTFGNPKWIPVAGDWTGSGKDHIGAYDPTTGKFYLTNDNRTTYDSFQFGNPNWTPLTGSW